MPAISPTIAPSDSVSTFDRMDLDGIQRGKIFKGQVPYKIKIARRLAGVCGYCGLEGHDQKICVKFICFNCGKVGHGASYCDQPKRQRLQELTIPETSTPEQDKEKE